MVPPQLDPSWQKALEAEWEKPYLDSLAAFLAQERKSGIPIYPPKELVFSAFNETPFTAVKVVVVGQDPYHGPGQAHGLSFSVPKGVRPPPSLQNIFKELKDDLQIPIPPHGNLTAWAKQGILLLNATLTVRENKPGSHYGKGWEIFTDAVIKSLWERDDPVIFVLWGRFAQEKCKRILEPNTRVHLLLKAAHPSPLSAYSGFFGSRPFSKINKGLKSLRKEPINWVIA